MTRQCPAAAYLSVMSSLNPSSSLNTDDLDPTRSMDHRKAFLRDMVDFMYRCHSYVKKAKEKQPGIEFKMCDNEKKDCLQVILSIIAQREKEAKEQLQKSGDARQAKGKIDFDPVGKSSPLSTYAGQTQLTGSPVSAISNLMGSREYPTPPRVYRSTYGSSRLATYGSNYGMSNSSASTDAGSPDFAVRRLQAPPGSRICGPPGQDLSTSYPSYVSYTCPYKQRSMNMASYPSARVQSALGAQYAAQSAFAYQSAYAPAPAPQNATAQTNFYECMRGGELPEYYETEPEVNLNAAFTEYDEVEYDDDDGQDEEYSAYDVSPSGRLQCACT